ncbi:hypothetical protein FSDG_01083 [Fusobacterium animalis 7_1]|uniref:Hemolysin n=2 Tax=Fusobacterium animalis TaxID=76859 RepID=R9RAP8_9FUSO|nr:MULTISPECIES: hypothetical protein [Fusobacterium]AGM23991.1 hypothetical protein HMPREF0409_00187 [Fusobacterium animalis 4_8]EEO42524.1 hypothetical protein FSDG_01083 [Fusobacterium animalis 7_1]EEW95540.1 hypothetical protein HMPREF0406_00962 [Fusobacterium animalis 3_1_33]EPC07879.1 hypothetical protein HMPREF9369_02687 [Fusobacterium polymorphum F0401]MCG6844114.1 hypothetical protein [Fusobacterium nucleatum]
MPKDAKGSTGSSYILDEKNRKALIPIDVNKIKDAEDLFGTLTEEVSHGKDALEGRQDKKVVEDETNDEKGLESLGSPANDYVKNKLGNDNNSNILLTTDGIDLSNADVGEKVGDFFPKQEIDAAGGVKKVLKPIRIDSNGQLIDVLDLFRKTGEFTLRALKAGREDLSLNHIKFLKGFNIILYHEDTKNLEKELEELKDGWGKGNFSDKEATIKYHYNKHKEEVGADSLLQYLRKAKAFSKNLRGAKKSNVMGATKGVIKYEKNGKYIEIAPNGDIISFGTIK